MRYHRFIPTYTFSSGNGEPDYSKIEYWAAHPGKHDPSDSVPRPLQKSYHPDSTADVFFIYPTTYTDPKKKLGWNAPIDNAKLNAKTDYTTILFQASIFNEAGRVYSPRYRQANYFCYFPKNRVDTQYALAAFELAYQDTRTAFLYYLSHNNNGRPIIIAAHSQGTTHAKRLLKEFFDGKPLLQKLVAAYLVGMAVEQNYFSEIQPCHTPGQTGCVTSWRSCKQNYLPDYAKHEKSKAIVTNPLTWDSTQPYGERGLNKGGILLHFNKVLKHLAEANVNGNVLWMRKPHFFGNILYTTKNYHVADMNLYYLNIRENVRARLVSFRGR